MCTVHATHLNLVQHLLMRHVKAAGVVLVDRHTVLAAPTGERSRPTVAVGRQVPLVGACKERGRHMQGRLTCTSTRIYKHGSPDQYLSVILDQYLSAMLVVPLFALRVSVTGCVYVYVINCATTFTYKRRKATQVFTYKNTDPLAYTRREKCR